jgi:hypothetical protein
MFKATLETFEIDRRPSTDQRSSTSAFHHRISNAVRTLRRVVTMSGNVISNGCKTNVVSAVERYQQQKARNTRSKEVNEFYFEDCVGKQRISQRAWRRHSAFLVYQHQMHKAQAGEQRKP